LVYIQVETWALKLREEHSLRAFVNRVLRRIFGRRRDKETREWRRLHNEELYALYFSPNIIQIDQIKKTEMGRACSAYGGDERCIQGFG
jgi:hypothetical protein